MKNGNRSLSFFMPAYNEEENIAQAVLTAHIILKKITSDFELIVVDDGSTDRTASIVNRLRQNIPSLRLISHRHNLGYGQSLRTGINAATKDYTFYTDADNQFDISTLPVVVKNLDPHQVVVGYRVKRQDLWQRHFISLVYRFWVGIVFNVWVKDVNCSFKLFPTRLFRSQNLRSNTVFIDAEMIILAKKSGYHLKEIPVSHARRKSGQSKFELGKKGVMMVVHPWKIVEILLEMTKLYPRLR